MAGLVIVHFSRPVCSILKWSKSHCETHTMHCDYNIDDLCKAVANSFPETSCYGRHMDHTQHWCLWVWLCEKYRHCIWRQEPKCEAEKLQLRCTVQWQGMHIMNRTVLALSMLKSNERWQSVDGDCFLTFRRVKPFEVVFSLVFEAIFGVNMWMKMRFSTFHFWKMDAIFLILLSEFVYLIS